MKASQPILVAVVAIMLAAPAFAHDPSQHKKSETAAMDCSKVDTSKMDSNDPVAKAIQNKCKEQAKHAANEHEHASAGKVAASAAKAGKKSPVAADCAKMKGMDMSKVDMNDPAVKAMHDKCMAQMQQGDAKSASHGDHKPAASATK